MGSRMHSAIRLALILGVLWVWWPLLSLAVSPAEQTHLLAAELRCPVCQNLSVADSPSEMANQMRELILEKLKNGETPEQVRGYFVSRYGEWILLAPTRQGFNWLAWLLPFVAILGGVGIIVLTLRRAVVRSQGTKAEQEAPLDPGYARRLEAELKEWER